MSRLEGLEIHDVYSEDGFRAWIKDGQKLDKDIMREYDYVAGIIRPALETLPTTEEAGKLTRLVSGSSSKAYARMVAARIERAAEFHQLAAGELGAAWTALQRYFLGPAKRERQPAFKVNKGSRRRAS